MIIARGKDDVSAIQRKEAKKEEVFFRIVM